jgi:hypothetical protein
MVRHRCVALQVIWQFTYFLSRIKRGGGRGGEEICEQRTLKSKIGSGFSSDPGPSIVPLMGPLPFGECAVLYIPGYTGIKPKTNRYRKRKPGPPPALVENIQCAVHTERNLRNKKVRKSIYKTTHTVIIRSAKYEHYCIIQKIIALFSHTVRTHRQEKLIGFNRIGYWTYIRKGPVNVLVVINKIHMYVFFSKLETSFRAKIILVPLYFV